MQAISARSLNETTCHDAFRPSWYFELMSRHHNDVAKHDESFKIDDPVECMLRELIQNILDAGSLFVRFVFRKTKFDQHVDAYRLDEIDERIRGCAQPTDKRELKISIDDEGYTRDLIISDRGKGLEGDYSGAPGVGVKPGPYQAFASGFGNSSKVSDNSGGSKGLGRYMIFSSSEANTAFVHTRRREDDKSLAFALAPLRHHIYRDVGYRGYGLYLVDQNDGKHFPPMEDNAADAAARALGLDVLEGGHGTTMMLPSVRPEFNAVSFMKDLIKNHMVAIILGLTVEVVDDDIVYYLNRDTLLDYAGQERFGGGSDTVCLVSSVITAIDALDAPEHLGTLNERFTRTLIEGDRLDRLGEVYDDGLPVSVSATFQPRKRPEVQEGTISYSVLCNPELKNGCMIHIRDTLATVVPRNSPHVVIVRSQGDAVARMLRDGEDASHTKWAATKMAEAGWPKNNADVVTPSFVHGGTEFLDSLEKRAVQEDDTAFASLFPMPEEGRRKKVKSKKVEAEDEQGVVETDDERIPPSGQSNPVDLMQGIVPMDETGNWGFSLALTDKGKQRLREGKLDTTMLVKAGYVFSDGSMDKKHSKADFDFSTFDFECVGGSIAAADLDTFTVQDISEEFGIVVRGRFDPARGVKLMYAAAAE